jgi:hypothetical protein
MCTQGRRGTLKSVDIDDTIIIIVIVVVVVVVVVVVYRLGFLYGGGMGFDHHGDDVYILLCDLALESEPEYELLLRPSMTTSSVVSIMPTVIYYALLKRWYVSRYCESRWGFGPERGSRVGLTVTLGVITLHRFFLSRDYQV